MSSPEEVGFAVLSRKFRRPLLDFFIRRTGSRIDAEDMVQDVFMRLAALRDLGPIYCGQGLLFRIASNLMLDRQRRNTVRTRAKLEQDVNWLPGSAECSARSVTPEEHLHNCQTLDKIAQVLGEMPDMMKDVFLLVRLEGMKQNEVSAMLGISISLVEKHLAKAAARLAKKVPRP